MNFSRSQLTIIGSVLFVVLLLIGIFTGIIPGVRKTATKLPDVTLNIWGVDDRGNFESFLAPYENSHKNVHINYEQFNPDAYEKELVNALAAGQGPDIAMFHNNWLPKHFNKLVSVDPQKLSIKDFGDLFPEVVRQDFSADGKIFALPLYVDTLALFYNQDTFDKNGIAIPPKDWLDFQNLMPKLRQKDSSGLPGQGNLVKMGAAIGGSNKTIDRGSDLLMLMMLQAGAEMTDKDFRQATFAGNVNGLYPGINALEFYAKFSDPLDVSYTWNENLGYSLDNFAKGDTAMIFNYYGAAQAIKDKNPFVNFKIAEMPQLAGAEKSVNYPDYWGLAVTNNSKNSDWAWDLILYSAAQDSNAENYVKVFNRPPALRSLIKKYVDHPELGVFAKQALSARSWPQIDPVEIKNIFSDMISAVIQKNLTPSAAANQAEQQVSELMRARR